MIEGRLATPKLNKLQKGDIIHFRCNVRNENFYMTIAKVNTFNNLDAYLEQNWEETLPKVKDLNEAKQIHRTFYSSEEIEKCAFLTFTLIPLSQ